MVSVPAGRRYCGSRVACQLWKTFKFVVSSPGLSFRVLGQCLPVQLAPCTLAEFLMHSGQRGIQDSSYLSTGRVLSHRV